MNLDIISIISKKLSLRNQQVENTIKLLDQGATIPFISRYRKEKTGSLDEVVIKAIQENYEELQELVKRKETILNTIEEQGKLTPQLKKSIEQCWDSTELEDIYLPYKPKRKTRATIAKEKGLEPLAQLLFEQKNIDVNKIAQNYVIEEVKTIEEALQGARDIIAEWISESIPVRNEVRNQFDKYAILTTRVVKDKEVEGEKYKDYFSYQEPLQRCAAHRLLAILRAESEGIIRINVAPEEEKTIKNLNKIVLKGYNAC
ncbi:MAG: Tex-like N-terminal domain-containing protein, partial [Bacteroidales bacterium]